VTGDTHRARSTAAVGGNGSQPALALSSTGHLHRSGRPPLRARDDAFPVRAGARLGVRSGASAPLLSHPSSTAGRPVLAKPASDYLPNQHLTLDVRVTAGATPPADCDPNIGQRVAIHSDKSMGQPLKAARAGWCRELPPARIRRNCPRWASWSWSVPPAVGRVPAWPGAAGVVVAAIAVMILAGLMIPGGVLPGRMGRSVVHSFRAAGPGQVSSSPAAPPRPSVAMVDASGAAAGSLSAATELGAFTGF